VRGWPSFAQPLETAFERTTETGRQRKNQSGNHDDPAFSGLLEIAMRAKPVFHSDIPAWQKNALLSRFLRNRFKQSKPAVAVVTVAVPFRSTVQSPFLENVPL